MKRSQNKAILNYTLDIQNNPRESQFPISHRVLYIVMMSGDKINRSRFFQSSWVWQINKMLSLIRTLVQLTEDMIYALRFKYKE